MGQTVQTVWEPTDGEMSWAAKSVEESAGRTAKLGSWWTTSDDGLSLLQRLALAHLLVGVCVALALGWQAVNMSGAQTMTPALGLLVAIGGAFSLLLSYLERATFQVLARLALLLVDLCVAGGILWLRGGEGWSLLVLLLPIVLAVVFFAERGGALAAMLAMLLLVATHVLQNTPASAWMPSLLVFLAVAVVLVALLGIYTARFTDTHARLHEQLLDAQASNDELRQERYATLARLHAVEQACEPLLSERQRLAAAAQELTLLAQRMVAGDPAATSAVQSLHPGAYGPLADLASALARLGRTPAGNWNQSAITAMSRTVRAQSLALQSLDTMTRSLCVSANELVMEAMALEPGVSLVGSRQYSEALWTLEDHLRVQSSQLALLGTQLADLRTIQENLETAMAHASPGAQTPTLFATSDIRPAGNFSGQQMAFGASAIRHPGIEQQGDDGHVRWGNWRNQTPVSYNRDI